MQNDIFVQDYLQLRAANRLINAQLVKTLRRQEIKEAARQLGMLKQEILVFDKEDEVALLMDFALYDVRIRPGDPRSAVERWIAERGVPDGVHEARLLDAMCKALFALFRVEKCLPGAGVILLNLFDSTTFLLMDLGLGDSAVVGMALAGRVGRSFFQTGRKVIA